MILSVCVIAIYGSSCSTTHQLADNNQSEKLHFIEGVTLDNNSSQLDIHQKKQTYHRVAKKEDKQQDAILDNENPLDNIKNKSLNSFIEQWWGVPYLYGGTTKLGIDCSAFVQRLYEKVYQTELVRTANQQFSSSLYIKDWSKLSEGDLVFFKIKSRSISHVGVYLGNGKFVHASASSGVMISDLNDQYWTKYYAGGGKIIDSNLAKANF